MAEDKKEYTYTLEDLIGFRPMMLAPELRSKEFVGKYGEEIARESIDTIVKDTSKYIGVKPQFLERHLRTVHKENFINEYTGAYLEALSSQKISDLRKHYDDLFTRYFTPENLPKINEAFNSDKKYSEIVSEYAKVAEKAKNAAGNFTKEEQEKAKKELQNLNKIVIPLQDYENERLDALKKPIYETAKKKRYNSLVEEDKKGEEGEAEAA